MATHEGPDAAAADEQVTGTLTDPAMIRALGHPARLTILEHLSAADTAATATELADVVGLSPSATSYHLREMAKHGLVREAEGRGDGRERRWQEVGRGRHVDIDLPGSGERRKAEEALLAAVLARSNERVTSWFARVDDEPAQWVEAAGIFDSAVVVTPAELAEITAAYQELLRPYSRRNRRDPPADARVVQAHLRVVPTN